MVSKEEDREKEEKIKKRRAHRKKYYEKVKGSSEFKEIRKRYYDKVKGDPEFMEKQRAYQRKYYERVKGDPKFKKKTRDASRKWVEENKEYFKEYVSIRSKAFVNPMKRIKVAIKRNDNDMLLADRRIHELEDRVFLSGAHERRRYGYLLGQEYIKLANLIDRRLVLESQLEETMSGD